MPDADEIIPRIEERFAALRSAGDLALIGDDESVVAWVNALRRIADVGKGIVGPDHSEQVGEAIAARDRVQRAS